MLKIMNLILQQAPAEAIRSAAGPKKRRKCLPDPAAFRMASAGTCWRVLKGLVTSVKIF